MSERTKLAIKFVAPSVSRITTDAELTNAISRIESTARISHRSEDKATGSLEDSIKWVRKIALHLGHESILEQGFLSAKFVMSRSASHQVVRHRLASIVQESQRYCDYSSDKFGSVLSVICPPSIFKAPDGLVIEASWDSGSDDVEYREAVDQQIKIDASDPVKQVFLSDAVFWHYVFTLIRSYGRYLWLRDRGVPPEDARYLLTNATATTLVITANFREWLHIFKMRADNTHAQWELRGMMQTLQRDFDSVLPGLLY